MKALLAVLIATLLIGCRSNLDSESPSKKIVVESTPSSIVNTTPTEPPVLDSTELAAADAQTQKYREKPPEFSTVDFANSNIPLRISGLRSISQIKFKNGEYEYDSGPGGRGWFSYDDTLFIDADGNSTKEAIVLATQVQCGGSCDGGSTLISILSASGTRPVLIDQMETGSVGYGCGLRSLHITNRSITVEVFGTCRLDRDGMRVDDNSIGNSKFQFRDTTRFVFDLTPSLKLQSREIIPSPMRNVMNYHSIVSVAEIR